MWYMKDKIDYNKPIFAQPNNKSDTLILLPQLSSEFGYKVIGYNWFSIKTGEYNSCSFFETAQEAIYNYGSYNIFNAEMEVKHDDS